MTLTPDDIPEYFRRLFPEYLVEIEEQVAAAGSGSSASYFLFWQLWHDQILVKATERHDQDLLRRSSLLIEEVLNRGDQNVYSDMALNLFEGAMENDPEDLRTLQALFPTMGLSTRRHLRKLGVL